jgi:hypothetical protein
MIIVIRIKYIYENAGYLVTFSKSSNIAPFDTGSTSQRDKKGNKVTASLHTYFVLFVMAMWHKPSVILTRLSKGSVEGGE